MPALRTAGDPRCPGRRCLCAAHLLLSSLPAGAIPVAVGCAASSTGRSFVSTMFVPRCTTVGYDGVVREIRWTSESEAHIVRHGVMPEEVEQAVNSRPQYEARGREDSTLLYCVTEDGRALLVVPAEAVDGRWYVATARDMTDTERRAFRRKGR